MHKDTGIYKALVSELMAKKMQIQNAGMAIQIQGLDNKNLSFPVLSAVAVMQRVHLHKPRL